jgi:hypothetical protein
MSVMLILSLLLAVPFLIKLGILYFSYIQWALAIPIPFKVSLFRHSKDTDTHKKPPIGFFTRTVQDPEPSPIGKKK